MDDAGIIELLFKRSERGIRELEKRFLPGCTAIAWNILGDHEDVQECVNDTWLGVWDAIPPARPDPLRAFIYRICRNQALKRARRDRAKRRDCSYDAALEELEGSLADLQSLEDTLSARELSRLLDAFLDELKERDRALFLRRYWFGDQVGDIARALGMTANAASARLSRLRQRLLDYLIREGYEL